MITKTIDYCGILYKENSEMIYKEMIHLEDQKNKVFHCGKHNLVLFNFNVDHDVMFPNI